MRARLGVLTLAIAGVAAVPALAAPDHGATLSAGTTKYEWDGSGSGLSKPYGVAGEPSSLGCGEFPDGNDCEDVLIKVEDQGDLDVTLAVEGAERYDEPTGAWGTVMAFPDVDVIPYASDATGAAIGEPLTLDGATWEPVETFRLDDVQPGYYLLRVEVYNGVDAAYTATAELAGATPAVTPTPTPTPAATPAASATPAPAPASQSQPAAKRKQKRKPSSKAARRAACIKKAKKLKSAKKRRAALKRCRR